MSVCERARGGARGAHGGTAARRWRRAWWPRLTCAVDCAEPELQDSPREPRLFLCSNATGTFKVEEVFNFSQDDLQDDDVMLLDTYTQVSGRRAGARGGGRRLRGMRPAALTSWRCARQLFIWIGSGANELEKREGQKVRGRRGGGACRRRGCLIAPRSCTQVAARYVEECSKVDGRDPNIPIIQVEAGSEPPLFTCNFAGWDWDKAEVRRAAGATGRARLALTRGPAGVGTAAPARSATWTRTRRACARCARRRRRATASWRPRCAALGARLGVWVARRARR